MRNLRKILCFLAFLSAPIMMRAQALPSLGVAKEITKGSLPNGLEYYLVTNPEQKGFADFALVREGSESVENERAALSRLPHFGTREPHRFLAENGIGYDRNGYMRHEGRSSVYSFHDVPVHNRSVADSTLLMLVDMVSTSPHPQAIVVCGDINVAEIKERLGLLSMMVPRLQQRDYLLGTRFQPRDSMNFFVSRNSSHNVATVYATFTAERLPREILNTVQPVFARTYAYILGQIVTRRAEQTFRNSGVPLASAGFRYRDSSEGPGPEIYTFSAVSSHDQVYEAIRLFAAILSDLDANGADIIEFIDAKQKLMNESKREQQGKILSNEEYVEKCISAYLYGSTLASEAEINNLLGTKSINPATELEFFNDFVSALLDCERNLILRVDSPDLGLDRNVAQSVFRDEWKRDSSEEIFVKEDYSDTLNFFTPPRGKRVKLMSETAEPITGGKLWTFANGIKVIYKQTADKGEFRYCMMLRGGVASVPALGKGESAFVGDMLFLNRIASMQGSDFLATLASNGVSMRHSAGISDFRIRGIAPKSKFPLVMRSLLSIAKMREPDSLAFERYRKEEELRIDMTALSPRNVNSLMDSIMRPDYYYTSRKYIHNLRNDLPARCDSYFDELFSKVNDGVLVFVGDLDEDELKRGLSNMLGSFDTNKRYAQRPKVRSKLASGSVTYTVESAGGTVGGSEIGVNVGMSVMLPFNMRNYMAFMLAQAFIRSELVEELAPAGAYVNMRHNVEVFPTERMALFVSCKPCRNYGLPEGISPKEPMALLPYVRKVTANLDDIEVSDSGLKAFKEELKSAFAYTIDLPDAKIDAAAVRYSEGKDMVSGYEEAIDSVDAALVKSILATLSRGAGVEYVIM